MTTQVVSDDELAAWQWTPAGPHLACAWAPQIPRDRLLIETDAPWITPRVITPSRIRPRRCEPCLLPHVCQRVAEVSALKTSICFGWKLACMEHYVDWSPLHLCIEPLVWQTLRFDLEPKRNGLCRRWG